MSSRSSLEVESSSGAVIVGRPNAIFFGARLVPDVDFGGGRNDLDDEDAGGGLDVDTLMEVGLRVAVVCVCCSSSLPASLP